MNPKAARLIGEADVMVYGHLIALGITTAAGVGSYGGIPLTHRNHAHACVFVTGHLKDGSMYLDWPGLARRRQTVVIYMGLTGLSYLCEKLMEHGLPADWPAAIVQHGTQPSQRTVTGTLTTQPDLAKAANLRADPDHRRRSGYVARQVALVRRSQRLRQRTATAAQR